ncbi:ABC transporter G family member 9-like [Dioscorea cayenensis subsp. rotundata]|uniref:ABC transporter G family member 9-like n=1 Tax=Dioscorea cayennensis subsp. rotundata TaxID=55577 RepID=A0AB40AFY4_DIOCR|nr:ABC transporter G family member 9-like [Dioscorea cayenensis subsp. rotundata]
MLAMMGPSGSGKTTLLTTLAGRRSSSSIIMTGSITYNNTPFSSSLNRLTGFVTQDDILYPHLTVFETLLYTALLRLPKSINKQQKVSHVETIITQFGLVNCRDNIIGDHYLRGISGGERKRVSIGQEVLIDPSLLFLDEPTSGLDSTTAQRIVSVVGELANQGKTVVMTIHQPSSSLFYMFHKVLILCEGCPLYFGKQSEVMNYFSSIGYSPSVAMNPADFLLDIANGIVMGQLHGSEVEVKEELVNAYNENLREKIKEEIRGKGEEKRLEEKMGVLKSNNQKWNTSWWDQFTVLIRRDLKERRHEAFSSFTVFQVLILSFISGALWWKSKSLQDQTGLLFFVTGFWGSFPLFQAIFKFPQERLMLMKERRSGMYRLSSYFMARIIVDLPMELILPTVSTAIVYWMCGLKPMPTNFFIYLSVVFLCALVTQGVGFAIGAAVMDFKVATMLASVIMLTFLLAGGFFVQHVPIFIAWIKYISYIYYTFKLLLGSQYKEYDTYECGNKMMSCRVDEIPIIKVVGLDHQGLALGVMLFMFMFYRLIAYVALMRVAVAE